MKCQATQTTTPNIVANVCPTYIVLLHLYGRGHKSRDCMPPRERCVSCGHVNVNCHNCHALCHGSKDVAGVAHARVTAMATTPRKRRVLLRPFNTWFFQPSSTDTQASTSSRERGEQYSSVAVVSTTDPRQHCGYPCRQTTFSAVAPSGGLNRSHQCTCQNASRHPYLNILVIVCIDEDACIQSEEDNHGSLSMLIPGQRKLLMSLTD